MNLEMDEKRICENVRAITEKWFIDQCKNEYSDFYIYFRMTIAGKPGEIFILRDDADTSGLELGWPERLRKDRTTEQTKNYISGLARHFPICSLEY